MLNKSRRDQSFAPSILVTLIVSLSLMLFSKCTRDFGVDKLSIAYKTILDSQSFCRYRRAVINADKSLYRPGETAYFTVYFFHLLTKHPISNCKQNIYSSISILDVNDKFIATVEPEIKKRQINLQEFEAEDYSVVFFSYEIPKDLPGGVFTAKIDVPNLDQVNFFVLNFAKKTVALIGDWNSDFVNPGDIVKGKLTFKVLTSDQTMLENPTITYRWTDALGKEFNSGSEKMINGQTQLNFKIPPFDSILIFSAEASSGDYKAIYKREFRKPTFQDIVIDFNVGTGKIVKDMINKIYFQAFATAKRDAPVPIKSARVIKTARKKSSVLIPSLSSDSLGKGMFEVTIFTSDVSNDSIYEMEVTYDQQTTIKYRILDLQKTPMSPVMLRYKSLYYGPEDTLVLYLETFEFDGKVSVIVQSKTEVLNQRNYFFTKRKEKFKIEKRNIVIPISDLRASQGGVFTVQVYAGSPSHVSQNQKTIDDFAKSAKKKVETPKEDITAGYKPPKLINFKSSLLQEIDIFIEPKKIIGVNLDFSKSHYLPGETVEYKISPAKKCNRCPSILNNDIKAVIFVTDESAFLEVEKSREASSPLTKIFLEREVMQANQVLPFAFKYIDHIFNFRSNITKDEIVERKRNVEYLLGNSKDRKFIFEPESLEQYTQQPFSDQYSRVRSFYEYLIPTDNSEYAQLEVFNKNDLFVKRKSRVANATLEMEFSPQEEDASIEKDENATGPDSKMTDSDLQSQLLKKDTIHYEYNLQKANDLNGQFVLPERVTNFVFRVFLFNSEGVYGYDEKTFAVRKPINIAADIPLFIYKDEEFVIPIRIENNTSQTSEIEFVKPHRVKKTLKPRSTLVESFKINSTNLPMIVEVNDMHGMLLASFKIAPKLINPGIYLTDGASGFVTTGSNKSILSFKHGQTKDLVKGNNNLQVCYRNGMIPILLSKIQEFNRIPYGCFEQASTTTFPIIIALKLLKKLPQTPDIIKLTQELIENLKKGIQLLLTYECSTGGFEWFGNAPGHSTLSAYGLWQFHEILQIDKDLIDSSLIDRIEKFLQSQKDNKGGFEIRRGLDSLGNPEKLVSDFYIMMVLSKRNLNLKKLYEAEYNHLVGLYKEYKEKKRNLDSYKLAIIGMLFVNTNEHELAMEIIHNLSNRQSPNGQIENAETSITRSGGLSLSIETTALTMILALSADGSKFTNLITKCQKFLVDHLKATYYISTQATILSLLALDKFIEKMGGPQSEAISFDIRLNGSQVGKFAIDNATAMANSTCIDLSQNLHDIEKKNESLDVSVEPATNTSKEGSYFFEVKYDYYSGLPDSSSKSPLSLSIAKKTANTTDIYSFSLTNTANLEQGMTVIEFNRPSCFDFNINDLELMRQKGDVDYYEVLRDSTTLVFYFRGLKAKQTKNFSLSLVKRFAESTCKDRAHSTYLYYDKDGSILYRKAHNAS